MIPGTRKNLWKRQKNYICGMRLDCCTKRTVLQKKNDGVELFTIQTLQGLKEASFRSTKIRSR